jgi:hypothetical protein
MLPSRTLSDFLGFVDDAIIAPPKTQSTVDRVVWQACFIGPICQGLCLVVGSYQTISPNISPLFFFGSPSHVAGLVVPIDVDTIQGMSG